MRRLTWSSRGFWIKFDIIINDYKVNKNLFPEKTTGKAKPRVIFSESGGRSRLMHGATDRLERSARKNLYCNGRLSLCDLLAAQRSRSSETQCRKERECKGTMKKCPFQNFLAKKCKKSEFCNIEMPKRGVEDIDSHPIPPPRSHKINFLPKILHLIPT